MTSASSGEADAGSPQGKAGKPGIARGFRFQGSRFPGNGGRISRLRLIDAVAIAAGAMLCLKVLGLASGSRASDEAGTGPRPRIAIDSERPFGGVIARARSNYEPPEVPTTGTVAKAELPNPERPIGPAPQTAPAPVAESPPPPASPSERALLERLGERREEWQQKGRDLEMRERLLENAERKLESRINDLKALEEKSEAAASKRGETEVGALRNLVTMYETMKPKEAARVFDRLPHDVLVPVVLQMNPRKMAEVLAVMAPDAAERLTVALANRARGKTEPASARSGPALPTNELPAIDPNAIAPARP
jgi:flagellar motility protein MotE (MotC chaperone)